MCISLATWAVFPDSNIVLMFQVPIRQTTDRLVASIAGSFRLFLADSPWTFFCSEKLCHSLFIRLFTEPDREEFHSQTMWVIFKPQFEIENISWIMRYANCELSLSCVCQFCFCFWFENNLHRWIMKVLYCAISFCKETNEQRMKTFLSQQHARNRNKDWNDY